MDPTFLWFCALGLILIGVVGTVLPGVPGAAAVFGGMLLAAWIDGFTLIGWPTLVLLGVLTALAFAADILGSLLGAKRVGASRLALIGAVVGALAGLPFGLPGLIFGPFFGAVAGEFTASNTLLTEWGRCTVRCTEITPRASLPAARESPLLEQAPSPPATR